MNDKEKIVKKLLFEIIDKLTKDADVYNHNGSLWLINTDSTKWIFEFTESKTLWYNYNFFRSALKFVSLDVNEGDNQKYITEWFESRYLNINQVKHTLEISNHRMRDDVDDTIQNGVKDTSFVNPYFNQNVEDTIQNGVKQTVTANNHIFDRVEDTIENGVKHTEKSLQIDGSCVIEDTIQNGVKDTKRSYAKTKRVVEHTIENGVKSTHGLPNGHQSRVDYTIQNGVKHTSELDCQSKGVVEETIENGVRRTKSSRDSNRSQLKPVEDIIENGVKETKKGIGIPSSKVDDTIENGVKNTKSSEGILNWNNWDIEDTIQNGVKETKGDRLIRTLRVTKTIIKGVKETKPMDEWVNAESIIEDTIEYGVKELQPLPAQDGNRDWSNYYKGKEDRTKPFNEYLFDAIRFGVKETHQDCSNNIARVEGIIRVGEKID